MRRNALPERAAAGRHDRSEPLLADPLHARARLCCGDAAKRVNDELRVERREVRRREPRLRRTRRASDDQVSNWRCERPSNGLKVQH